MAERLKIGNQEVGVGTKLDLKISEIGNSISEYHGTVEDIRGGGFYGKALLFPDLVVKTTQPDPWHLFWRRVNRLASHGSVIFPSQVSEAAAKLDFLSTKIIHKTIPHLTKGLVTSPDSLGFTELESLGYAQVLERMHGRGARFDVALEENTRFKNVRHMIWNLGVALGLEHSAQVHPKNPFGKPNLWTTDGERFIWLDTLPAIPHTGFVFPFFYFDFHKDVNQKIGMGHPTFNRIHTDRFRSTIHTEPKLIPTSTLDELDHYLCQYDHAWEIMTQESNDDRKSLINFAIKNGVISQNEGERISNSDVEYCAFITKMVVSPAINAFIEFTQNTPIGKTFYDERFRRNTIRYITNPQFRRDALVKNGVLKGIEHAYQLGLISEEEYEESWNILRTNIHGDRLTNTYLFLQSYYLITGALINSISIPIVASSIIAENPMARLSLGLFIDLVIPSVVRAASTATIGLITHQDLSAATIASSIPKLGSYIGVPADIAHKFGKESELIWHYTKRELIASLSKVLRPWGGWNSDLEAILWERLRMEKW